MKRFRDVVFWAHLVTALLAGAVVLVMSVTGVLLTYQRQVTAWADTRGLGAGPPAPGAARLAPDALLREVRATVEGTPTAVTWRAAPDAPAEVAFGRGRTVFANAYTGEVLGEGSAAVRAFFRKMVDWHRWLGAAGESRDLGRAVTGASNLAFLFLVLSGFYLWWPRNWSPRALRNVTLFRGGLSGKARDFNWHNVIGFWSALPLALVVGSAVVISYPWASDLVYRVAGDTPPAGGPRPGGGGGGDAPPDASGTAHLLARAERQVEGWRSITLQLPAAGAEKATFTIDTGDGGQPHKRANLTLDRAGGEVVGWEPFSAGSRGRQLRSFLRFAHTGEVAGIPGQTLAGLVSAGAVLLVWTGFALSWRRFRSWRSRGQRPAAGARRGPDEPARSAA